MQLQKTVPSLSNEKKKKVISYTPGAFALNKILVFLVSAEERDKATLRTIKTKFISDADVFNMISDSKYIL